MNTIRIAVCDDSAVEMEDLTRQLQRYADEKNYQFEIRHFSSGREFLEKYKPIYQIIFLDIRISDTAGDKLAEKIRRKDKDVPIIFTSAYLDAVFRGYELGVQSYLRKPVRYQDVADALDRSLHLLNYKTNAFFWENGRESSVKIYYSRLEYIETELLASGTSLHYDGRTIVSCRKLKEFETLLRDPSFFRCNNSYIVNLYFADEIVLSGRRYEIVLRSGEKIPMSRGKKEECMKRIISLHGHL